MNGTACFYRSEMVKTGIHSRQEKKRQ